MVDETKMTKSISYKILAGCTGLKKDELTAKMRQFAEKDTVIGSLVGEVNGYTSKAGTFGENIAFFGDFIARSEITGEVLESTKMFFNKEFADQIKSRFDSRKGQDESVKFSATIAVVTSTAGAEGYAYMVTPLKTPEAISKRAEMLVLLSSAPMKALSAPKKR